MDYSLLIISIVIFLLSAIAALFTAIIGKNFSEKKISILLIFQFVLTVIALLTYLFNSHALWIFYIRLFSICSGLILSGLLLRKNFPVIVKMYGSVFFLFILFFIWSPSRMFLVVAGDKGSLKSSPEFYLGENYFLLKEQNSDMYKIYNKRGLLKDVVARNLDINFLFDSVTGNIKENKIEIKFFQRNEFISDTTVNIFTNRNNIKYKNHIK